MPGFDFTTLPPELVAQRDNEQEEARKKFLANLTPQQRKIWETLGIPSTSDIGAAGDFEAAKRRKVEQYLNTSPIEAADEKSRANWNSKSKAGKVGTTIANIFGAALGGRDPYATKKENRAVAMDEYKAMAPVLRMALNDEERTRTAREKQELEEKKQEDSLWRFAQTIGMKREQFEAQLPKIKADAALSNAKTAVEMANARAKATEAAFMEKNGVKMGTATDTWRRDKDVPNSKELRDSILFQNAAKAIGASRGGTDRTTITSGRTQNNVALDKDLEGRVIGINQTTMPLPDLVRRTITGGGAGGMNPMQQMQQMQQMGNQMFGGQGAPPQGQQPPPQQMQPPQQRPPMQPPQQQGPPQPQQQPYQAQGPSMAQLVPPNAPPPKPQAPDAPAPLGGGPRSTYVSLGKGVLTDPKAKEADLDRETAIANVKNIRRLMVAQRGQLDDFMGPTKNWSIWGIGPETYRRLRPGGKVAAETEFETGRAETVWNTALDKSGKALSQPELKFANELLPSKDDNPNEAMRKAFARELLLTVQEAKRRMPDSIRATIDSSDVVRKTAANLARRAMRGENVPESAMTFQALFPDIPLPVGQ